MYDVCTQPTYLIYTEGGMSVQWFTEMLLSEDQESVEILAHYRLYWDEYDFWPKKCKKVKPHTGYYGTDIWREAEGRISTHYFVPLVNKWVLISNPMYVFSFGDHKVDTEKYQKYEEEKEEAKKVTYETHAGSVMAILEENSLLKMQGSKPLVSVCENLCTSLYSYLTLPVEESSKKSPVKTSVKKTPVKKITYALSRKGKRWTPEEENILKKKYEEGCSVDSIAEEMHRTSLAIACRLVLLKIIGRIEDARGFKGSVPQRLIGYAGANATTTQ